VTLQVLRGDVLFFHHEAHEEHEESLFGLIPIKKILCPDFVLFVCFVVQKKRLLFKPARR